MSRYVNTDLTPDQIEAIAAQAQAGMKRPHLARDMCEAIYRTILQHPKVVHLSDRRKSPAVGAQEGGPGGVA